LIPVLKNDKDLNFIYGFDIILDASISKDEKNMRSKQSYMTDINLLFAWDCPLSFENLCKQYSDFSNYNQIFILRPSDYQAIIPTPTSEVENFQLLLKLKKNNRFNKKSFIISIQKPKLNFINKNENITNDTMKIPYNFDHIGDLFYIDYRFSKREDIFFELKSLENTINYSYISITWTVQHFSSKDLYLNGRNEKLLRVKSSDLLIGNNEIICEITNVFTSQTFNKLFHYNVDPNPFGGNCLVYPNQGIAMHTNFTIIQEDWKGGALPFLFKIKCKTISNIYVDISNGGFFSQSFNINKLPEGNNHIYLEVSDQQGRFVLFPCLVKVKNNDNQYSLENYLNKTKDIYQKMVLMDVYLSNLNDKKETQTYSSIMNEKKENQANEKKEITDRINILETFNQEIYSNSNPDSEKFFENFETIISFLLELSKKNLKEINLEILYNTLNIIISNIDPFIDDLKKIGFLYKIIDNLSDNIKIKRAEITGIFINHSINFLFLKHFI